MQNWFELADSRDAVTCSPVSFAEVFYGMRDRGKDAVERAFSKLIRLPVNQAIGLRGAAYLRLYYKSHALGLARINRTDAKKAARVAPDGLFLWLAVY